MTHYDFPSFSEHLKNLGIIGEKSISEESEAELNKDKKGKDRSQSVPTVSLHEDDMEMESDGEKLRRISTDSGEESATTDSSRKSSGSQGSIYRRRSSHLSEFLSSEQPSKQKMTPEDPDHKSTSAIQSEEKKRRRLSVETHQTIKVRLIYQINIQQHFIQHFIQKSHFENLNFPKIHNFKLAFFAKFTFSKSQFSQSSHF